MNTPMIPTPFNPEYVQKLTRLARNASNMSDRLYSGSSIASNDNDAGFKAEVYATKAMCYRLAMMSREWRQAGLDRLQKALQKLIRNGSSKLAQTDRHLATRHFMSDLVMSQAPDRTAYIAKVMLELEADIDHA